MGADDSNSADKGSIVDLDLGTRATNALRRAGIHQVEQLERVSAADLLALTDFGTLSLRVVEDALAEKGTSLKPDGAGVTIEVSVDRARFKPGKRPPSRKARAGGARDSNAPDLARAIQGRMRAAGLQARSSSGLGPLTRAAGETLSANEIGVLQLRLDHTLAATAERFGGISRERVRQLQKQGGEVLVGAAENCATDMVTSWRSSLAKRVLAEKELCGPWIDPDVDLEPQRQIGRILLKAMGAVYPLTFRGRLTGWWTFSPELIKEFLGEVSAALPFEETHLSTVANNAPFSATVPVERIFSERGSPARYHEGVEGWVRANARHRDAAYLLMVRNGEPMSAAALAETIGMKPHAMRESLRRDDRFRQLRPSGDWTLKEWGRSGTQEYEDTLDAALSVLGELGPLSYAHFERHVIARYPVSPNAVRHVLASKEVGRWPDGCVDLAERGAPLIEENEPPIPDDVEVDELTGAISFSQPVTHDVLRGSGLRLPRYVTWWLGLRHAPDERSFETGTGEEVKVMRALQGPRISSLRRVAQELGAREGCVLAVRLDTRIDRIDVSLACANHPHV